MHSGADCLRVSARRHRHVQSAPLRVVGRRRVGEFSNGNPVAAPYRHRFIDWKDCVHRLFMNRHDGGRASRLW